MGITTFYEAWTYLENHAYFLNHELVRKFGIRESIFASNLQMDVVRVNPFTQMIEDCELKNTQVEIWLENGPMENIDGLWVAENDTEIASGGRTFEEAVINMAHKVEASYPVKEWGKINE